MFCYSYQVDQYVTKELLFYHNPHTFQMFVFKHKAHAFAADKTKMSYVDISGFTEMLRTSHIRIDFSAMACLMLSFLRECKLYERRNVPTVSFFFIFPSHIFMFQRLE